MKSKLVTMTLAALLMAMTPAWVQAEMNGWYLGASVGGTNSNVRDKDVIGFSPNTCDSPTLSCSADDNDVGFSLYGGYRFNRYLGVEGGYVNLGDTVAIKTLSPVTGVTSRTVQETDGLNLLAVGLYPLLNDKFALLGRLGLFYWFSDIVFKNSLGERFSANDNGPGFTFGFGASYEIYKGLSLRFTWDRYLGLGEKSGALQTALGPVRTVDVNADMFSFGVTYHLPWP